MGSVTRFLVGMISMHYALNVWKWGVVNSVIFLVFTSIVHTIIVVFVNDVLSKPKKRKLKRKG